MMLRPDLEAIRKSFGEGRRLRTKDDLYQKLVSGIFQLQPNKLPLDYTGGLRWAEAIFEHKYGRDLRVITNPDADSFIETLAESFEQALKNRLEQASTYPPISQVRVITHNKTSDILRRLQQQYPQVLQFAQGNTTSPVNSEIITDKSYLVMKPDLIGEIFLSSGITYPQSTFDYIWLKLTNPEEFEKEKAKQEKKPVNRLMRFLFRIKR